MTFYIFIFILIFKSVFLQIEINTQNICQNLTIFFTIEESESTSVLIPYEQVLRVEIKVLSGCDELTNVCYHNRIYTVYYNIGDGSDRGVLSFSEQGDRFVNQELERYLERE